MKIALPKLFRGKWTLPEYDEKLATLRSLSADLGLPVMPDLHIGVTVEDRGGKVLEDRYEQGHSWTRNAWNIFTMYMLYSPSNVTVANAADIGVFTRGSLAGRSTDGTMVGNQAGNYGNPSNFGAGSGAWGTLDSDGYGIQVGASTEPFSVSDFCLFSLIKSGTATGRLSYQAQSISSIVWDNTAATYTSTYKRVYNNNSPAAIIVNEIGFVSTGYLLSRDLLSSPVNIPVGGQLTVTVTITSTSFAALEAGIATPPAIGSSFGGGTYLGAVASWVYSPSPANGNSKYGLVLSPKIGGEAASKQYYNTALMTANANNDLYYGGTSSAILVGYGSASTLGQFCAAQNTANLGGYNDWYIPSDAECATIGANFASISTGEKPVNATYWSSSQQSANYSYFANLSTNSRSYGNPTTLNYARLVRRVSF